VWFIHSAFFTNTLTTFCAVSLLASIQVRSMLEAGGRIIAAERHTGRFRRAQIYSHFCEPFFTARATVGSVVMPGDDLALVHRRQEGVAGADRTAKILHLQPGFGGQRAGEEIRRRAEARNAERLALPVRDPSACRRRPLHQHHSPGAMPNCTTSVDELAFGLQVDGVIVKPTTPCTSRASSAVAACDRRSS